MSIPHKHAAVIKAWADGAEIEGREGSNRRWMTLMAPNWLLGWEYRVKVVQVYHLTCTEGMGARTVYSALSSPQYSNLRLTFEDGKLVKAEVI